MLSICLLLLDGEEEKQRFTDIYNRHKRLVYHTAWKVLHDDHLAEDIVQEVFLYLAKNFSKIPTDNCHKLARYLVVSSEGRAINLLHKRRRETPDDDPAAQAVDPAAPDPADAAEAADAAARMAVLVTGLKEIYRAPLALRAEGLEVREIAGLLGVPEATVRKRMERGRKLLWKEWSAQNEDEKDERNAAATF